MLSNIIFQERNMPSHYFFFLTYPFLFLFFNTQQYRVTFQIIVNNTLDTQLNTIVMHNFHFITCSFGLESLNDSVKIYKYLKSISHYVPGATVVIGVSTYTIINPTWLDFDLKVHIQRYNNETKSSLSQKYSYFYYYFNGLRYKFYVQYFMTHPEVIYAIFCDDDSLILRNPFELLKKDPDEIHVMGEIFPFSQFGDFNSIWLRAWNSVSSSTKQLCGMHPINRSLYSKEIKDQIPWNSGLMMGKVSILLTVCKILSSYFFCAGMFRNNAEQGLLNYIRLSGQFDELNIKFHPHSILQGSFISSPYIIPLQDFNEKIANKSLFVLHHYNFLEKKYFNTSDEFFNQLGLYEYDKIKPKW